MFEALLCHLVGDFCLQNDWMAAKKREDSFHCGVHVAVYTAVFLAITQSIWALLLIAGTHFLIDRFGLARKWCEFYGVGFPWSQTPNPDKHAFTTLLPEPEYKTFWLIVVVDQSFHLVCNYFILLYLSR